MAEVSIDANATAAGDKASRAALGLSSGGMPPTVRAAFEPATDVASARAFTRALTASHYENFSVVTSFIPRHLRQDFCNVYAFCRVADDLGDEVGDRQLATRFLADFRAQTEALYRGETATAVFLALRETVEKHAIPSQPFLDLISAFQQDQTLTSYQTWDQLLDYCRRSADPVGRLVLYMTGYRDPERQALSDKTCTALQLANFWQDVRRDILERGRIYLPADDMQRFAVTPEQLRAGQVTPGYRELLKCQVDRTQALFGDGRALLGLLHGRVRAQVRLFGQGGEAILQAIRRQNYDTLTCRPRLSKLQKLSLMLRALPSLLVPSGAPRAGSPGGVR